jgi:hypothetical protein
VSIVAIVARLDSSRFVQLHTRTVDYRMAVGRLQGACSCKVVMCGSEVKLWYDLVQRKVLTGRVVPLV